MNRSTPRIYAIPKNIPEILLKNLLLSYSVNASIDQSIKANIGNNIIIK